MTDSNQDFRPFIPEKKQICEISRREAVLLSKLRRYSYGKFMVHKANNVIIRLEINDSQLIEEDDEANLE